MYQQLLALGELPGERATHGGGEGDSARLGRSWSAGLVLAMAGLVPLQSTSGRPWLVP